MEGLEVRPREEAVGKDGEGDCVIEEEVEARGEEGAEPVLIVKETGAGKEKLRRFMVLLRGFLGGGLTAVLAEGGGIHWGGGVTTLGPSARERARRGGAEVGFFELSCFGEGTFDNTCSADILPSSSVYK